MKLKIKKLNINLIKNVKTENTEQYLKKFDRINKMKNPWRNKRRYLNFVTN